MARLAAAAGITPEEQDARAGAAYAIGRLVTAEEIADVIAFLASPRSVPITGDAVVVAGGHKGAIHY